MLFWVACVHLHGDWVYYCIVIVKQFNSTTCALATSGSECYTENNIYLQVIDLELFVFKDTS
jgi:hypothetical protein